MINIFISLLKICRVMICIVVLAVMKSLFHQNEGSRVGDSLYGFR